MTLVPTPTATLRRLLRHLGEALLVKGPYERRSLFRARLGRVSGIDADLQDFAGLPIEVQSEILRRAHHINADLRT
jgi:hypothetical protein